MRVAQHFESWEEHNTIVFQPVERSTESLVVQPWSDNLSRPLHGLRMVWCQHPSTQSAGLLSSVRSGGLRPKTVCAKTAWTARLAKQPRLSYKWPDLSARQPQPSAGQPELSARQPMPSATPADAFGKPADAFGKPADVFGKPAGAFGKPAGAFGKPAGTLTR
jgi:hypothetical protein